MKSTKADRDAVRRLNGLYVGQLTNDELESFNRCVDDGTAHRSYQGVSGLLGLAKVVIYREQMEDK